MKNVLMGLFIIFMFVLYLMVMFHMALTFPGAIKEISKDLIEYNGIYGR